MPSKKKRESLPVVVDPNVCAFCNLDEDNEEVFGKLIKKCDLTVHYFCMLFSSGLSQGGKSENEGIFGFMPEDIMKEVRRGARLRCTYCKQKGATIGCVVGACRRVFHFGCGKKIGTLHQYYDSFRSFCEEHRPRQVVSVSDRLAFYGTANTTCAICMTSVETRASNETLRAPCCHNSWFHRSCISKHAMTAGLYFFKCPLCNNKEIFQEEMLKFGIYLPDQDAAWETEPDAFRDLLERYLHCDARTCHCPKGRDYNKDGQKWEIIVCSWCGSQGSHVGCHSLSKVGREDVCQDCKAVDKQTKGKHKTTPKGKSPVSSKPVEVDLNSKCKSEYPGKSDKLVKKKLPTKTSTISSPSPSSTLSPGTVLRLSYEETDDELNVVDSVDSQPSTSQEYNEQSKKRKKDMKNVSSKRQKLFSDEGNGLISSKIQPSSTVTGPAQNQESPVKSTVRQSALAIQAKRAHKIVKRTRSVGLSQADTLRLERMMKDPKVKLKRSKSNVEISPTKKKKKSYRDPWRDCKGPFSRKKSKATKKRYALNSITSPLSKDSKGRLLPRAYQQGSTSTGSCSEDTGMSAADDSPVKLVKKKGILMALLAGGTESNSSGERSEGNNLVSQSTEVVTLKKRLSGEQIPKASKKTKSKKGSRPIISQGQTTITKWLKGRNGTKGSPKTTIQKEKGNMENDINFLNQREEENGNDEKSLIIKYKGKQFMLKKENATKSEKIKSQECWPKSDMPLTSESNTESVGSTPKRITRRSLNENINSVMDEVLLPSSPLSYSPALCTRLALSDKKQESVNKKRLKIITPKTFPRGKNRKFDLCENSDMSDSSLYGTPRRSTRCSLNTKFQNNLSGILDCDDKSEPLYISSSSPSSHTSESSELKLLYLESDSEEENEELKKKSMRCESESEECSCLMMGLEENKLDTLNESLDSSVILMSDFETSEVAETKSSAADGSSTSTYIIESFSGNHGYQQLSISVPSV